MAKCARMRTRKANMETLDSKVSALANEVRLRRKELDFTQEELAIMSGVSRRLIIEFEKGKSTIALDRLLLITRTLGLDLKLV